MTDPGTERHSQTIEFTRETDGLPQARKTELVELADGGEFELEIIPIKKRIGDATVRMLAYNGSVPGPTLRVPQGATVTVHVTNQGDLEATVHWHGLRLENRYDGTHDTQAPIPVGERFTYQVHVPDPGAYWYHPHIREDYGQELGLYGNILAFPSEPDYWPPANRELLITLDDILIEDGRIAAFGEETTHVAMGRFGNVMLVAGEPDLHLEARRGEVVRFYFTNTANTRVFNVTLPGAQMKLVGADAGHYEHEKFVDEVLLAPSERVVVDVLFPDAGEHELQHRTPDYTYRLASIAVTGEEAEQSFADEFARLRTNRDVTELRKRIEPFFKAAPDKTLSFVAEMEMGVPEGVPVIYVCPMHPEVVSEEPGSCPKCGMKLLAQAAEETTYVCPMHPEVTSDKPDRCPKCGMKLLPAGLVEAGGGDAHAHHHGHGHESDHEEGMPERATPHTATSTATTAARRPPRSARRARARSRHGAGDRVGRRHGRGQPANHAGEHALEARRSRDRRRERPDRLDLPSRRPGQGAARERDGLGPSDAAPVPCPRSRTVPDPCARRHGRAEPRLEGHGARPHRRDRRHPPRRHEPRPLDGSLPHRRAPRERHDAQLQRRSIGRVSKRREGVQKS